MGNFESAQNIYIEEPLKQTEKHVSSEDEIFTKISQISFDLFNEYNNEFLKDDFCNKLALIYENKLSKFNIKILQSLYDNINSNKINNDLLLTMQYIPKEDDKFFVNIFNDNLNGNFWQKNVEIMPNFFLLDEKLNLDENNITSFKNIMKNINHTYINQSHVNNLLASINKLNQEYRKNIVDNTPKIPLVGGDNKINKEIGRAHV